MIYYFLFSLYLTVSIPLRYNDLFFKGSLDKTAAHDTLNNETIKNNQTHSYNKTKQIKYMLVKSSRNKTQE